jgi:hypothetical protein
MCVWHSPRPCSVRGVPTTVVITQKKTCPALMVGAITHLRASIVLFRYGGVELHLHVCSPPFPLKENI